MTFIKKTIRTLAVWSAIFALVSPVSTASLVLAAGPAPIISSLTVNEITESTGRVVWSTDQPSSSQLSYGKNGSLNGNVSKPDITTDQAIRLSNLDCGSEYSYRLVATNTEGTASVPADGTFNTLDCAGDNLVDQTQPIITGQNVSGVKGEGVTIVWSTDEPASTQLNFGTTSSFGTLTPESDVTGTNFHVVTLTGLNCSTTYYYQMISKDPSGNTAIMPMAPDSLSFRTTD